MCNLNIPAKEHAYLENITEGEKIRHRLRYQDESS